MWHIRVHTIGKSLTGINYPRNKLSTNKRVVFWTTNVSQIMKSMRKLLCPPEKGPEKGTRHGIDAGTRRTQAILEADRKAVWLKQRGQGGAGKGRREAVPPGSD